MKAAIYFPLFLVLIEPVGGAHAIYYLAADLQTPTMFTPRKPLRSNAKRSGWQGFRYELADVTSHFVRLA